MDLVKRTVVLTFTEPLLGTVPRNPEVYKTWTELKDTGKADETPPEGTEEKGWTGFHTDEERGLHLFDYQIKGFLKEAATIVPWEVRSKRGEPLGETAIKHRLDNWVFVFPRRIYLGKVEPDGVLERPLRARTMQGERITLVRSDLVNVGTQITFEVAWLPHCPITELAVRAWLDYGALKGLGQWRNGGYGKFTYELTRAA